MHLRSSTISFLNNEMWLHMLLLLHAIIPCLGAIVYSSIRAIFVERLGAFRRWMCTFEMLINIIRKRVLGDEGSIHGVTVKTFSYMM